MTRTGIQDDIIEIFETASFIAGFWSQFIPA